MGSRVPHTAAAVSPPSRSATKGGSHAVLRSRPRAPRELVVHLDLDANRSPPRRGRPPAPPPSHVDQHPHRALGARHHHSREGPARPGRGRAGPGGRRAAGRDPRAPAALLAVRATVPRAHRARPAAAAGAPRGRSGGDLALRRRGRRRPGPARPGRARAGGARLRRAGAPGRRARVRRRRRGDLGRRALPPRPAHASARPRPAARTARARPPPARGHAVAAHGGRRRDRVLPARGHRHRRLRRRADRDLRDDARPHRVAARAPRARRGPGRVPRRAPLLRLVEARVPREAPRAPAP